jgi:hypothetical protein
MAIEPTKTYDTKEAAAALNINEGWTITWRNRAIKQGLVKEQGKVGSGLLLGRDYITICRMFWQSYEEGVRWHHFNLQRAREQGRPIDGVIE